MAAVITGDKALDRKLARLSDKDSKKARRETVKVGMREIAKGIKSEVPIGTTKTLKKSVNSRYAKAKRGPNKGITEAKAGVNVGRKSGSKLRAFHAHLVALGTGPRYTGQKTGTRRGIKGVVLRKTGNPRAYRGVMPANNFVERGFNKSAESAKGKMLTRMAQEIEKAARKK